MYAGKNTQLFQADANYGAVGATINMIVQADNTALFGDILVIRLLPALPSAWGTGSVRNARVRGGVGVNISWKDSKITAASLNFDKATGWRKKIQVVGPKGKVLKAAFVAPTKGSLRVV